MFAGVFEMHDIMERSMNGVGSKAVVEDDEYAINKDIGTSARKSSGASAR